MLSLFKNKISQEKDGYFPFTTDIHSHILPGLDDGSPDLNTSIELISGLMKLGINRSVATPHIIGDLYRNNHETIGESLKLLQNEILQQQLDFKVSAAAEYMLDGYFYELLSGKLPLLTIKDNLILTEFSYSSRPDHIEKMSFGIITAGYVPILAHPERYAYFHNDMEIYHRLKDIGFMLQVNLLSLTGYYGKDVAKASLYILKNELASYLGTDLHHQRHLLALQDKHTSDILKKYLLHQEWNQI